MTFLMVNGVKTFYMEFGSGNPIIFYSWYNSKPWIFPSTLMGLHN